jgi:hypothetical protein
VLTSCYEKVALPLFKRHILGNILRLKTNTGRDIVRAMVNIRSYNEFDPFLGASFLDSEQTLWERCERSIDEHCQHSDLVKQAIVFRYTFPRLDAGVTKRTGATIRLPFSCHQDTGKLCLPIPIESMGSFSPEEAPTFSGAFQTMSDMVEFFERSLHHPSKFYFICTTCYQQKKSAVFHESNQEHREREGEHSIQTLYDYIDHRKPLLYRTEEFLRLRALCLF